jgi:heterodisulfide reductase subunit C
LSGTDGLDNIYKITHPPTKQSLRGAHFSNLMEKGRLRKILDNPVGIFMTVKKINYEFRERLNHMLGGFSHNFCYQCGACVADCPTHRFMPEFSPRNIILQALYGMEEELTGPDSLIWNCTNCYNCYERCPQEVNPVEVIIALKNIARQKGNHAKGVDTIIDRVSEHGVTVLETDLIKRRRAELDLPEFKIECVEEVTKLITGEDSGEKK